MSFESFLKRRKPLYLICCESNNVESKEWESIDEATKALYKHGFLSIMHQAHGTRFWYVYCSKSEWEKANAIVKKFGLVLSKEPVSAFFREIITGHYI